ncbi:MAG: hypothetical protein Q4A83_06705 [Bacillota bacterium]|nr:hypothetical protein [Bacillota bacterium]
MDRISLRLIPVRKDDDAQELILRPRSLEASTLDTVKNQDSFVYCDYEYTAKINGIDIQNIKNHLLLLNECELDYIMNPSTGEITFGTSNNDRRIFTECFGYVQFQFIYTDIQGIRHSMETDFIQVMVRRSRRNESVRRMVEYVYSKNTAFLFGDKQVSKDTSGMGDGSKKTLEASIRLLSRISLVFEGNYHYFKANSRFTTVASERVDHFEKLQFATNRTLQYIAQHPEELYLANGQQGIKIGDNNYQPGKTLITSNVKSFDIYENQVLLAFLRSVIMSLDSIEAEILRTVNSVPQRPFEKQEYVTSTYFVFAHTIATLNKILVDVRTLRQKYYSIQSSYEKILQVKRIALTGIPKLTPIFRSIPQYHQIYECIVSWYSYGGFTLSEEKYMLSFLKVSSLYEVYVLAKIINFFRNEGFCLVKTNRITYPFNGYAMYTNTTCENYFAFQSGDNTVEVYYQPVIYSDDRRSVANIGLYRSTSIGFSRGDEDPGKPGRYYSPDYIIKYSYAGFSGNRYIIADAKFSSVQTVKSREVPKLAYKYLFSVACFEKEDSVSELCIFNGQSDFDNDGVTDIYDFSRGRNHIVPGAEIVTLTENATDNEEFHLRLLRSTIGKFRGIKISFPEMLPLPSNNPPKQENAEDMEIHLPTPPDSSASSLATTAQISEPQTSKNVNIKYDKVKLIDAPLTSLPLDETLKAYFEEIGLITIRDLVPNLQKSDLASYERLNRDARRHVEGVLKDKGIKLSKK